MSMVETHKGKLVKLKLGNNVGVTTKFPGDFAHVIFGGEVYEVKDTVEYDIVGNIAHYSIDAEGNIDYVCQFNSGGSCLDEELGDIIKKIEAEPEKEETVTISKKDYDYLCSKSFKLRCLESVGVDSWSGYYYAMEKFYRNKEE